MHIVYIFSFENSIPYMLISHLVFRCRAFNLFIVTIKKSSGLDFVYKDKTAHLIKPVLKGMFIIKTGHDLDS